MSERREFEVTEQHLALLRRAYVRFYDWVEFGAPGIDPKRPYGNSGVYDDIGEILDIEPVEDVNYGGEYYFTKEQQATMRRLHEETATALEIALKTGGFEPGVYVTSDDYSHDWQRHPDQQTKGKP